jgi:hypothetical protein
MATSNVTVKVSVDFGPAIQQLRDLADRLELRESLAQGLQEVAEGKTVRRDDFLEAD